MRRTALLVLGLSLLQEPHARTSAASLDGRFEQSAPQVASSAAADGMVLDEARRLSEQSRELRESGKYDAALTLAERALTLREKALGSAHLEVADSLHLVALLLDNKHDYAKAEAPNVRALAIRERALGPDHPDVALSLYNLAWLAKVKQDFAQAESLYRRTLDIQERALGPDHRAVTATLNDMAVLYNQQGRYDAAIDVNRRVLGIRERTLGVDHAGIATSLNNLARTYELKADYTEAEALLRRALVIRERASGPNHPETAFVLDGLARIATINGDFTEAEPLFKRVLAIRETALGPEHTEVGTTLNNLAALYRQMGDNAKAEPLLLRDLAITEKGLGRDHAFVAPTLSNLAGVYTSQGRIDDAEASYRRALSIQEKALGPEHSSVATTLNRLGDLYLQTRPVESIEAEPLFERAQKILVQAFGPDHPAVADSLNGLAVMALRHGDRASAESRYQRALAIRERALGPTHIDVADSLERLALIARQTGDVDRSVGLLSRALDIRERHLDHNLPLGSERQKVGYLKLFADDTDQAMSLLAGLAAQDPKAIRLALTTTLRRKGRALDATSNSVERLRQQAGAEERGLFDRVSEARSRLAAWTLRGPAANAAAAYRARLTQLEGTLDQLEADVSARSAAFRAQSAAITIDTVRLGIPEDAALIEFVSYRLKDDTSTELPVRYAAFTLTRHGDPRWVDLGDAARIDRAIHSWRRALADPARVDTKRLARALDAMLMAPVRALVTTEGHWLIAPDGALNLIPLAALVDENNRFLVERHSITYLTSGRDLLRLRVPRASRSRAAIVGAPAFGDPALGPASRVTTATGTPTTTAATRVDDSRVFFGPLPGAGDEVRALRALLPEAAVLVGEQATEAAVRRLSGPRILHIATHGFFQGDADSPPSGSQVASTQNPLLRSGLALAGANRGRNGSDDGVMTALETIGLDLWGTKLVVLSACDTALGVVSLGEGVYGLRRALILAGSESQLMTLWRVSDRSTRDLMIGYYTGLTKGEGRGEALRQAQLSMLHDRRRQHPYYWASFIQSGEWARLDDDR